LEPQFEQFGGSNWGPLGIQLRLTQNLLHFTGSP
jgi:hypothetical protein